jgi:hypothetical protein
MNRINQSRFHSSYQDTSWPGFSKPSSIGRAGWQRIEGNGYCFCFTHTVQGPGPLAKRKSVELQNLLLQSTEVLACDETRGLK